MYDLAIIGGGPAGATLARLIGNQYKVLLLERRTFEEPLYDGFQKCCGGLMAPDAQKLLASFSLGLPKAVVLSPQMFAVRTIDFDNKLERYYQRHYINIDREEFDKWLISLVLPKVNLIKGACYHSHVELKDRVKITFSTEGKTYEEEARLLVGADGAFSKVRRTSFPKEIVPRKYVAIQEWFESLPMVNYYGAIFDREITDFYSWIIPKEGFLIIGSALDPNVGALQKFELLKRKLKDLGFEFKRRIRKNGTYLLRPQALKQINLGNGRVGLVGEAAGWISPSSAEGFSYAFRSAVALASAITQDFDAWRVLYHDNTAQLRRNIILKNLKSPFMYHPLLRRWIMKSGLLSIDLHTS